MIVEERDRQSRLEHNMAYRFAKATAEMRFFKPQSDATSLNLRDLDALAQATQSSMWEVLKELETDYLED